MGGKNTESPSSTGMTEKLLTSRFGSHESVCKPDQPDLGQVMVGRVEETGKVDQIRRNIYKVGSSMSLWSEFCRFNQPFLASLKWDC